MFNNLDLENFAKMMNDVQDKFKDSQLLNDDKTFEAKSGGGLVSVKIKGNFEIVDLSIDDSLLDDSESLEILLMGAFNEAIKMVISDKSLMFGDLMQGFAPPKS